MEIEGKVELERMQAEIDATVSKFAALEDSKERDDQAETNRLAVEEKSQESVAQDELKRIAAEVQTEQDRIAVGEK